MSGMAEVLAGHFMVGLAYTEDQATSFDICKCGERANDIEQHQAAMLTAAGFGPVKEAQEPEVRYATFTSGETELDEVVARDAYVHLEAMNDNHWWLLVTAGGKSVHVNFYTKRAKISGHAEVEEAEG